MTDPSYSGSALTRGAILGALSALSDELGRQGVIGEVCLFGGTVMVLALIRHLRLENASVVLDLVGQYYPEHRIPMRAKYLVEGLFEEGTI